ncbi:hypothetical protein YP72344_31240 [Yersinia pseudotuberculosis]|nr:hypothetical protein YP72344_31240 [Yersinia pseudotuberculosis]BET63418.1 hypothetical protein YPSE1_28770 [Yersinia pseudotuberculosis]GAE11627.1 hypothetical protein YP1_046_00160 [Yersinia pseudotuberculosis NBRC 105692]
MLLKLSVAFKYLLESPSWEKLLYIKKAKNENNTLTNISRINSFLYSIYLSSIYYITLKIEYTSYNSLYYLMIKLGSVTTI